MKSRSLLWLSVCIALSACVTTPVINYHRTTDKEDPASPPAKSFVFAFRSSIALLVPYGTSSSTVLGGVDGLKVTDACATSNDASNDGSGRAANPGVPTPAISKKKHGKNARTHQAANSATGAAVAAPSWEDCVEHVAAAAAPARTSQNTYFGKLGYGTTVSTASIDSDPLLLKSITVNYKNPVPGLVTSAGTNAATGFAVAGPWGAVGGFLVTVIPAVAEATTTIPQGAEADVHPLVGPGDILRTKVCLGTNGKDQLGESDYAAIVGKPPKLMLPIAISVPLPHVDTTCWNPLPLNSTIVRKNITPQWFYRVSLAKSSDWTRETQFPPTLFDGSKVPSNIYKLGNGDGELDDRKLESLMGGKAFPVNACRAVILEIAWWKMHDAPAARKGAPPEHPYQGYPLKVADPDYIQAVSLANGNTITVGAVCGGYASYSPPSTTASDLSNAAFNAAAAILKAQQDREKASKK